MEAISNHILVRLRHILRWGSPMDSTEVEQEAHKEHKEHKGHKGHKEHKEHKAIPNEIDAISKLVVDAGLKVHKSLGPGLLESTYEHCLAREFRLREIAYQRQVALPIFYEGEKIEAGYRTDMVVEDAIIIEVKAIDTLTRVHEAQLLTYLKFSSLRLGFLMNFNVTLFTQGLRRMVR